MGPKRPEHPESLPADVYRDGMDRSGKSTARENAGPALRLHLATEGPAVLAVELLCYSYGPYEGYDVKDAVKRY